MRGTLITYALVQRLQVIGQFRRDPALFHQIFIERLWRTLEYERIYLKCYVSGTDLARDLTTWFTWYNGTRRHSSLDKRTPDEAYFEGLTLLKLAA